MAYLIKRGRASIRGKRHAHLAKYNAHGEIVGAWCPASGFDLTINVPLGLKTCKHCVRLSRKDAS